MSSAPSSDPDPGRNSGSALRIVGRLVTIVLVVTTVLAVRAFRQSDPGDFFVIVLILLALVALRYAIPAIIAELRRDKPSIPISIIKLLLSLFGAAIALFSVAAVWSDGTVADLPVGIFRFGYQGASAAFTSSALLGLSVCGLSSAIMNFAGRRLGWLRGLGLLVLITVAGGLLAPVASSWHYRQLEA